MICYFQIFDIQTKSDIVRTNKQNLTLSEQEIKHKFISTQMSSFHKTNPNETIGRLRRLKNKLGLIFHYHHHDDDDHGNTHSRAGHRHMLCGTPCRMSSTIKTIKGC